jgi:hypothetical protein
MTDVKVYKIFIASPSDVQEEREVCDKVFDGINKNIGHIYGFRVESKKWEKDARPSFGHDGQDVINKQLLDDFQLFIGIMWHKFGTPTPRGGSGTEEEFDLAFEKLKNGKTLDLLMYFNQENGDPFSLDMEQVNKIKEYKKKIAGLGGLYTHYNGADQFETHLYDHLNSFFREKYKQCNSQESSSSLVLENVISEKLNENLDSALCLYLDKPTTWIEPCILPANLITSDYHKNYSNRINLNTLINVPYSTFIQSPPQFGLTCLAHYLIKEAWRLNKVWCYIDANVITRFDTATKRVNRSIVNTGYDKITPDCIIVDDWDDRKPFAKKLLKDLCTTFKSIPIIVMAPITEQRFNKNSEDPVNLGREFGRLNLMALPRSKIREVICDYNNERPIGNENKLLERIISDFDTLNIHRTAHNCLTLLKVTEAQFDDSLANRTQMIERILFILFNLNDKYIHKSVPDVKDCEYALGRFCEYLIKEEQQVFERELFIEKLTSYCTEKLLYLDISFVFDIMYENNILVLHEDHFMFKGTYWIYYFAARRMYANEEFKNYILNQEEYVVSPEIIEFYSGIDRNRGEVLEKLNEELKKTFKNIENKAKLGDEVIPLGNVEWNPSQSSLLKMKEVINEGVQDSDLPTSLKDKYADNGHDQLKPYEQSINSILKEYEFSSLIQQVKAISRALRNSDYVSTEIKREILNTIKQSWKQVSKILFALGPMLAQNGQASFEGQGFTLADEFSDSLDVRMGEIWTVNPQNVIKMFKDDIYSKKIGPLLYDGFINEDDPLIRHLLILLFINERPVKWLDAVNSYIESIPYNSFYLGDVLGSLRRVYKYDFIENEDLKNMRHLIKKVSAIHEFKGKYDQVSVNRIKSKIIPKRSVEDIE